MTCCRRCGARAYEKHAGGMQAPADIPPVPGARASSVQYGGATRARVSGSAYCRGAFAANDMGPAGQMPMKVSGRQTPAGKPPVRSASSLRVRESSRPTALDGGATRARVSGGACCRDAFAANYMGPAAGQMPMKVCGRQTAAGKPPARSAASLRARESSCTAVQDGRETSLRMGSGPACAGDRRRGGRAVSPRCALSGARSR